MGAWSATTRRLGRRGRRAVVATTVALCLAATGAAVAWTGGSGSGSGLPPTAVAPGSPGDEAGTPEAAGVDDAPEPPPASAEEAAAARRRAVEVADARQARRAAAAGARREEAARRRAAAAARRERRRVTAFQQRLAELGYLIGPVDGAKGQQTAAAVMAFQAVNGLQVDGVVGPRTRAALDAPPASPHLVGGPGTRIEIDLTRQVLHLVEGGTRVVTMKASSGNGERYGRPDGSEGVALTPVGRFTILRRIPGRHESTSGLGAMYDPMYFHGPFAVHGSGNVPPGPASHGCVRLSMSDAAWLYDRVPNGTPVVVHGGTHTFTP